MVDRLVIRDFLDAATRASLVAEMRAAASSPATVYGKSTDAGGGALAPLVRKVARLSVSDETRELVRRRLLDQKSRVEEHFGVSVNACEEPQFLRYEAGDFFVAHQDGNTQLIFDDSRLRKLSVVIFLSRQSSEPAPETYGGGSLVFHGRYPDYRLRLEAENEPGTLLVFRAETTHEVMPVTHGQRYTIVSWYR